METYLKGKFLSAGIDVGLVQDNNSFVQKYAYFHSVDVEKTVIDTRGGSDIVHADPNYLLGGQTWGVTRGDVEAQATAFARLEIRGGSGPYPGHTADPVYQSQRNSRHHRGCPARDDYPSRH